jgi:hypothetical protein
MVEGENSFLGGFKLKVSQLQGGFQAVFPLPTNKQPVITRKSLITFTIPKLQQKTLSVCHKSEQIL